MPAVYVEDGRAIATNSMLSSFIRCPKQAEYKYVMRLKPKMLGKPLSRGKWVHELLEVHGNGGDWKEHHRKLSAKFEDLFDEEKDFYGDMPREIARVMMSYFWHYKNDPWKVLESELTLECELPDGTLFRCRIDWLIENQWGIWLVDHKTHKTLPDLTYRMLDTQSPRYVYAALANDIPVKGFIWNYIRWKAPSVPKLLQDGSRLSRAKTETDYPTFVKALRRYELDPEDYRPQLDWLKSCRYVPGEPQNSSFFQRVVMEKQDDLLARVEKATLKSVERMHEYDFSDSDAVERDVETSCKYRCSFTELCAMELLVGRRGVKNLLRQNYRVGDPLDYYQDRAGEILDGKE